MCAYKHRVTRLNPPSVRPRWFGRLPSCPAKVSYDENRREVGMLNPMRDKYEGIVLTMREKGRHL